MNEYITMPGENTVSVSAAAEYEKKMPQMLEEVNKIMYKINEKEALIGDNPVSVMYDNHNNHAVFMSNIFNLNDYKLLKNTIAWVISSYGSRGFKKDYFPIFLNTWINVINKTLEQEDAKEITGIYEWMISILSEVEKDIINVPSGVSYPFGKEWESRKNKLVDLLLKGDSQKVLAFSLSLVNDRESLQKYYIRVVTHAMYEIGRLWQDGSISVVQEHLATAMVMRSMTALYMKFVMEDKTKGKVIVTASANEYHEVGARIVADILEMDGWDVMYIGANTPVHELIKAIEKVKPEFVCISVTMTFNMDTVKQTIKQIRQNDNIKDTKIIVGGYAFSFEPNSKDKLGADKIGLTSEDLIQTARNWWIEKKHGIK